VVLAAQIFVRIVNVRRSIAAGASVHKFLYFSGKTAVFTGVLRLAVGSGYVGILNAGIKDFLRMD